MANRKTVKKRLKEQQKQEQALQYVREKLGGDSDGNARDVQSSRK